MKDIRDFKDVHTHRPDAGDDAVVNLPLCAPVPRSGWYSVGLHPWDTAMPADEIERAMAWVRRAAADPRVVAVGEAGMDALRGASLEEQERVFTAHALLAEEVGKPLIIHTVRTLPQIMALRKKLKPRQLWIIHGYRGNAVTAKQLLRLGFAISLGRRYNPEILSAIPADRLFHETDDEV